MPRPGNAAGHIQRDIDFGLDIVIAGRAKHAGVRIFYILINAADIKRIRHFVDGQGDFLAQRISVAAADGLLHKFFGYHADIAPGIAGIIQPAARQDGGIALLALQRFLVDAGNRCRDGGIGFVHLANGGAAHLLRFFNVVDLVGERFGKFLDHRIRDKVFIIRAGIFEKPQPHTAAGRAAVAAAFLGQRYRDGAGTGAGHAVADRTG